MEKYAALSVVALALILSGCTPQPEAIGGERDKYGCLFPAGYSYSEDIGACTRAWEIDDEGKSRAAKAAVDYVVDSGINRYALTVTKIEVFRCPGCYEVTLEQEAEYTLVKLSDWEATSAEPYTP